MGVGTNRRADYRYRKGQHNDAPVSVNLQKSVLDMRKVYLNLTDTEFAALYQKKWGLKVHSVLNILKEAEHEQENPKQAQENRSAE